MNNRKATAIRYIYHHQIKCKNPIIVQQTILGILFNEKPANVKKALSNKTFYDVTYQAFLVGKEQTQAVFTKNEIAEMLSKHQKMKNWRVDDTWKFFVYDESEWHVPKYITSEDLPPNTHFKVNWQYF